MSFESYLLSLSIISSGEISMGAFHSLIHFCYVFCVLRVHVKVLLDLWLLRSLLINIIGMRDE